MGHFLRGVALLTMGCGLASIAQAGDYELSGQLKLDKRLLLQQEDWPQYPIYHQAFLKLTALPSDEVELTISSKLRVYDFAAVEQVTGLQNSAQLSPMDLLLWQSYVDIYGMLDDRLDLRIGKQRIAWGTADRFNPTDNLNPDDLTDFLDFGAKLPTWALLVDFIVQEEWLKLTGVLLPGPVPAMLPRFGGVPLQQNMAGGFSDMVPSSMSMTLGPVDVAMPVSNLKHSMQALKASGNLLGADWSLSYFHGYDDIPIEKSVDISLVSLQELYVDSTVILPEIHVVGADFAREFFTVGFWLEAALFFPQEVALEVTAPTLQGTQTKEATVLHSDPYMKLTAGLDYTLPWGTYVNFQYVHGLFAERGGDLHDYFVLGFEHTFLDGALKLTEGWMLETDAFEELQDNYGASISFQLTYKPYDNIDLMFGHVLIAGQGKALFAQMDNGDQTYAKMKVSF